MNTITFDGDRYSSLDDMFRDVTAIVKVLIKNEYYVSFRYDDCNIYVLDYAHNNEELNDMHMYWLNDRQADSIIWNEDDYNENMS